MGRIRLYDIIKKHNIGLHRLVDFLKSQGVHIDAPTVNTHISDAYTDIIHKKFSEDSRLKETSQKVAVRLKDIIGVSSLSTQERENVVMPVITRRTTSKVKSKASKTLLNLKRQQAFDDKYSAILKRIQDLEGFLSTEQPDTTEYKKHKVEYDASINTRDKLECSHKRLRAYVHKHSIKDSRTLSILESHKTTKAESKKTKSSKEKKNTSTTKQKNNTNYQQANKQHTTHSKEYIKTDIRIGWSDIYFDDKKFGFKFRENSYSIICLKSRYAYNTIIKGFSKRLQPIDIHIEDSRASLKNPIAFDEVIEILRFKEHLFHITDAGEQHYVELKKISNLPKDLLHTFFPLDKTEYLSYLQDLQDEHYKYLPVFESNTENPDGFLFTIKKPQGYILVWESINDVAHKATYVFEAQEDELLHLQQLLFDYIMCNDSRKRINLRHNRIKEFVGFDYSFIDHNDFNSWSKKINSLLKVNLNSEEYPKKNEAIIEYTIENTERTYIPKHNIMQNRIKTHLEETGTYAEVLLESENVDIKALTKLGEWHFFEIKTSSPKKSIRQALGQILEYAHYSSHNKVKKLFIVGPDKMDVNEKQYIRQLRNLYNIPVWYLWYDLTTQHLNRPDES